MNTNHEDFDKGFYVPGNPLEMMMVGLDAELRASGLTLIVKESQDSDEYTASIPQGRRPQRRAKPGHAATIMVEWGYETHSVTLTPTQWESVMSGHSLGVEGPGYFYDGEHFQDYWSFAGGYRGTLEVSYGDDGAVGVDCRLCDANIAESVSRP
jgi:hypothetical protein